MPFRPHLLTAKTELASKITSTTLRLQFDGGCTGRQKRSEERASRSISYFCQVRKSFSRMQSVVGDNTINEAEG
jgi:hypothetical protein